MSGGRIDFMAPFTLFKKPEPIAAPPKRRRKVTQEPSLEDPDDTEATLPDPTPPATTNGKTKSRKLV